MGAENWSERAGNGEMLSSEDGQDNHLFSASILDQYSGAFLYCRTSCEDIVEQQDGLILHGFATAFAAAKTECPPQIGQAISPAEKGLLAGIADSSQGVFQAKALHLCQGLGDLVGLIEPAPMLSTPMEWNWDDDPGGISLGGDPRVVPDFAGEGGEFAMQVDLSAVLVGVHEFARLVVGRARGPGELKAELAAPALGTEHIFRDEAIDVFPALNAEWFLDARKVGATLIAEITSLAKRIRTQSTRRGVEEVEPACKGHRRGRVSKPEAKCK